MYISEEDVEEFIAEDRRHIENATNPQLPMPDIEEVSKPFGFGENEPSHRRLDFQSLVDMRRWHQTLQAAHSVRTKSEHGTVNKGELSIRQQLIRRFHEVLKEQQDHAISTGCERAAHW
jgi:hypothetical protein